MSALPHLKSSFSSGLPKRDRVKADVLRVCSKGRSILKSSAEPGCFPRLGDSADMLTSADVFSAGFCLSSATLTGCKTKAKASSVLRIRS